MSEFLFQIYTRKDRDSAGPLFLLRTQWWNLFPTKASALPLISSEHNWSLSSWLFFLSVEMETSPARHFSETTKVSLLELLTYEK